MPRLRVLEVLTGILTVPNLLTFCRLLALPAVILLFRYDHFIAASLLFLGAMLTDVIDGWLARLMDQRSRLGLYLDS
ncbi:MAG: CDP-alcohol phosphatidyltransferase family protein, partial [Lentisphaerales bacterium]